ncbi:MAG TPA: aspartate/glutamate racemase family protein [Streptosporangiaceae bacterium]|nr:aspartate/glutamate racemase family protein [Streptosporangiaceae bacterium]
MLRIAAIAPLRLTPEEMDRRQRRYHQLGGDAVRIDLTNLGRGAPRRLETAADIARSETAVREVISTTDPARYDCVLPDCVLDPAAGDPPEKGIPVFGILRLAVGHLASLGLSFAAVTRNSAIADELLRRVNDYGLARSVETVRVLDADFCLISDDSGWSDALSPVTASLARSGTRMLLNGCSAVDLPDNRINGVTVVDPTKLAIRVLALAHEQHLLRTG